MSSGEPSAAGLYASRVSRYGYRGIDVRESFAHLPFQAFWTWLSGKAVQSGPPKRVSETLLSEAQLCLQIAWSWSLIVTSIYVALHTEHVFVRVLCIVLVMNRTRGLLHTFHYTTHGASIRNMRLARVLAKLFMSIPILHASWEQYRQLHIVTHHQMRSMCTDEDPDQKFMIAHGFHRNMRHGAFWLRTFVAPFLPSNILRYVWGRIDQNFIHTTNDERLPRMLFWAAVLIVCAVNGWLPELALYYLLPLLVVTQYSSYIQHITEHVWFPPEDMYRSPYVRYASLTWGRFLGRPYPRRSQSSNDTVHALRCAIWVLRALAGDLPMRLFVFMQDLSCHDFHHRSPGVNFWRIAQQRSDSEGRPSKWGPMTETWSVLESVLILRDHLVFGRSDPFELAAWERELGQHEAVSAGASAQKEERLVPATARSRASSFTAT